MSAVLDEDETFYFHDVVFQAGTTLFRVPMEYLPRGEGVFDDTFSLPNVDEEGHSNEKPIILPDQVTAEDFRSLLKVLFSQPRTLQARSMTMNEWSSVLRLCTMWCLDTLRARVIAEAGPQAKSMPNPVDMILIAKQHNVSGWLIGGYRELSKRAAYLSRDDQRRVGFETATRLAEVRERSWEWSAVMATETYYKQNVSVNNVKGYHAEDVVISRRSRVKFDFDTAIHDIFKEELNLDKDYVRPKLQVPSSGLSR